VKDAVSRLERLAGSMGIEVASEDDGLDLAVTLGGDGSMLRAFHRFLDKGGAGDRGQLRPRRVS
jgi:NAD kinase